MVDTYHVFIHDPIFLNRARTFAAAQDAGGVGTLSAAGLSYFRTLYTVADTRQARTPQPHFGDSTRPVLLFDSEQYPDLLQLLEQASDDERASLFAIIDRVVFKYSAAQSRATVDQELASSPTYPTFVANSLVIDSGRESDTTYYPDNTTGEVIVPTHITFRVTFVTEAVSLEVEIQVWASDTAFKAGYPITTIQSVAAPLPYPRLLSDSLIGTGANAFSTALTVAQLNQSALKAAIANGDSTGYTTFQVRFVDNAGNSTMVPFNILYKGVEPDRMACRLAIKALLLNSGTGNAAQWRARAPSLFIDARFYIIPMWNNTVTRQDQVAFPSIIGVPKLIDNAKKAMPGTATDFLVNHLEFMTAAYDTMSLAVVPHDLNEITKLSLQEIHTTYQNVATDSPTFAYMAADTKQFATKLQSALAVAAGKASNPDFLAVNDAGAAYVSFDVAFVEICVMTKESYANRLGVV